METWVPIIQQLLGNCLLVYIGHIITRIHELRVQEKMFDEIEEKAESKRLNRCMACSWATHLTENMQRAKQREEEATHTDT